MTPSLTTLAGSYNGAAPVEEGMMDAQTMTNDWATRYHDATAMAAAFGKRLSAWRRHQGNDEFLPLLAPGIPLSQLVVTVKAADGRQRTWVHPDIAPDLAQWCSVKLRVALVTAISARVRNALHAKRIRNPTMDHLLAAVSEEQHDVGAISGEYERAINRLDSREEWEEVLRLTDAKSREMGFCQPPTLP
jgi:KilA-N domain